MNKKGIIVIAAMAALLAVMGILVGIGSSPAKMAKKNLTVVTAPDQDEAMENEQFTVAEYISPKINGKNVAIGSRASANGYTDVYPATNAVDGRRESISYWEGPVDGESILTVNLKKAYSIHTMRVALNPDSIWG